MKKFFYLIFGLILFFAISCGQSKEEYKKEQRIEDSLHALDRENSVDNAINMLDSDLDSLAVVVDSLSTDSAAL